MASLTERSERIYNIAKMVAFSVTFHSNYSAGKYAPTRTFGIKDISILLYVQTNVQMSRHMPYVQGMCLI